MYFDMKIAVALTSRVVKKFLEELEDRSPEVHNALVNRSTHIASGGGELFIVSAKFIDDSYTDTAIWYALHGATITLEPYDYHIKMIDSTGSRGYGLYKDPFCLRTVQTFSFCDPSRGSLAPTEYA